MLIFRNYVNERISDENMSPQRLAYILEREAGTHILRFHSSEQDFGYVFWVRECVVTGFMRYRVHE
jgi:hypothetical protein